MNFFERLDARARQAGSLLCVGIDPRPQDLADDSDAALRDFCFRLVDATAEATLAFKPNAAFFERRGPGGMTVLRELIAHIPDEVPVILDAKRGDIASTAEAYAEAIFDVMGADATTLSPYLGHDSLTPFLRREDRGVFLLCRTSNPGSRDLQALPVDLGAAALYERVAELAVAWSEGRGPGLVVGATQPESLRRVRQIAPESWILAPGVGAQGADLATALSAGLRADGLGLLINASRGISGAADPGAAARALRDDIEAARRDWRPETTGAPGFPTELAEGLLDSGCVRFGRFRLKSGLESPVYIDLRLLAAFPRLLAQVARAYLPLLRPLAFDRLAPLPYAALPIGTAVSLAGNWPMVYPRKEAKGYGTKAQVEGAWQEGETAVILDDLATTAGSKLEAIEQLAAVGLRVRDVVVLVDRESGAREAMTAVGCQMHAVFTLSELVAHGEKTGRITPEQAQAVRDFLAR